MTNLLTPTYEGSTAGVSDNFIVGDSGAIFKSCVYSYFE